MSGYDYVYGISLLLLFGSPDRVPVRRRHARGVNTNLNFYDFVPNHVLFCPGQTEPNA